MIYAYVVALAFLLIAYTFYFQISSLRWDENERRRLEMVELRLAHILRLQEAPDVRIMMLDPKTRQSLFLDFSDQLRRDIFDLLRLRALKWKSLIFVALFFAGYYLMRLKSKLFCSPKDLRFLSGLELALVRSLD